MLTQILKVIKVIANKTLSLILVKVIKTQDTRKYKYGGDSYDTAYQKVNHKKVENDLSLVDFDRFVD